LFPKAHSKPSAKPFIHLLKWGWGVCKRKVIAPSHQKYVELFDSLLYGQRFGTGGDLPNPLFCSLYALLCYAYFGLKMVSEAKSQEFSPPRSIHRAFLLINLEFELLLNKSGDGLFDSLASFPCFDVDIAIVRKTDEFMSAFFEFFV
jgi:hypothetical protein